MDWQAAATQLLNLVLTDRSFDPGFDWEANWPALLQEFREAVKTDSALEAAVLREALAERDAAYAAEQRLRQLGASDEDLQTLRGKS